MKTLKHLEATASLALLITTVASAQVDAGQLNHATGNTYFRTQTPVSISTAKSIASSIDGHLVSINDQAEQDWLLQTFGELEYYWIGLERTGPGSTFEWMNGDPLGYSAWCSGEPNGHASGEDYAVMNWHLSAGLPDIGCWNDVSGGSGDTFRGLIEVPSPGTRYCFGDGSGTSCPCGNASALGGCSNSTGGGALLDSSGSTNAVDDDLVLTLSGLPANKFGLVFLGTAQAAAPFRDGIQCVGNIAGRFPVRMSDAAGVIVEGPGLAAHSLANFGTGGQIIAGSTLYFQGWYRDQSGPCGMGSNMSNGVRVEFGPSVPCSDAEVLSLDFPSPAIGGTVVTVTAQVRNNGSTTVSIPVRFCLGADCETVVESGVPPGAVRTVATQFLVPTSNFDCGGTDPWTVSARTMLSVDCDSSNNQQSGTLEAVEPFWDLRFQVVNAPSSVGVGGSFNYSVRVTNVGNVHSANVCAITGINLFPGAGSWGANLGILNFSTGTIAPGSTATFNFNYTIPFGAFCNQTQYLKAEIHYSAGCSDDCPSGNYEEDPIFIGC